jgi:hypothetical protein
MESFTLTAAYDPNVYNQIDDQLNVNQTITVTYPDGSTLAFYGWLRRFEPADNEEGTQPEATITIEPSNTDPADFTEEGPVLTEVAGT